MPFFEPPEIPDEQEPGWPVVSPPEWAGPARNVLGMPVGERVVLVHRADLAIAVTSMIAFPNGVEFQLLIRGSDARIDEALYGPRPWRRSRRELSDDVFRLGVATADGTTASYSAWYGGDVADPPPAPHLTEHGGGGGGGGQWEHGYWLWPLPPDGPFEVVCEWPALDVPETHVAVDPAPIRAAAMQSLTLWDEDHGRREGGWTSY